MPSRDAIGTVLHSRRFVLRSDGADIAASLYNADCNIDVGKDDDLFAAAAAAADVLLPVCRVSAVGGRVLPAAGADVVFRSERYTVPEPGNIFDRNFSSTSSFVSCGTVRADTVIINNKNQSNLANGEIARLYSIGYVCGPLQ